MGGSGNSVPLSQALGAWGRGHSPARLFQLVAVSLGRLGQGRAIAPGTTFMSLYQRRLILSSNGFYGVYKEGIYL